MKRALPPGLLAKYEQRQAEHAVVQAEIGGLVSPCAVSCNIYPSIAKFVMIVSITVVLNVTVSDLRCIAVGLFLDMTLTKLLLITDVIMIIGVLSILLHVVASRSQCERLGVCE
jgi:hypothetical protein